MNIDELTIGEAKKLAAMFGGADTPQSPHIGKKCIIRTYASGIHFGMLVSQSGRQIELKNARRLWRWDVKQNGVSLSEVANHGGTDGRQKFTEMVSEITLLDGLEIIPCTETAARAIEAEPVAKP